ncbi:MAG: hypothetical protein C0424_10195 [Sphingobacteriaceae bacterium]|nr:hypothetical protein [Sphingobacteriaceae bacterium]
MKVKIIPAALFFVVSTALSTTVSYGQKTSDHYIKSSVVKGDADETIQYGVRELVSESNKDRSAFEMIGVKRLDNGDKFLVIGKHQIPSTHAINGTAADLPLAEMLSGKGETKFYEARFPQVSYNYITIDENDAKNLLEKVKQLRQNYIDSDTAKVKNETRFLQYRLNDQFAVSMSKGKNGSSAKYFELIIGNRRQIVNSDKFILYLVEFLAY